MMSPERGYYRGRGAISGRGVKKIRVRPRVYNNNNKRGGKPSGGRGRGVTVESDG